MKRAFGIVGVVVLLLFVAQSLAADYIIQCSDQACGTYLGKLVTVVPICNDGYHCYQQGSTPHWHMKWTCRRWLCSGSERLQDDGYTEYCGTFC